MGNYHEYLKNQPQPLRELETQLVRQHMFGNPFKLVSKEQRNSMFGADEIDEVFEESAENQIQNNQKIQESSKIKKSGSVVGGPANKRKGASKGPLSKRINYLKNLYTSNTSSSASSIISETSDLEILEETSSVSEYTTRSFFNENRSELKADSTGPDVGNLNDFNDVEMQSIEINEDFKVGKLDPENDNAEVLQHQRPLSASSSSSSSSSSSNEQTDFNGNVSSSLCDNYIEQSYIHLKILCVEKIKKPGQDYSDLFELIQNSQISIRMRLFLLKELVYEAMRLKRCKLIDSMNKYGELLEQIQHCEHIS